MSPLGVDENLAVAGCLASNRLLDLQPRMSYSRPGRKISNRGWKFCNLGRQICSHGCKICVRTPIRHNKTRWLLYRSVQKLQTIYDGIAITMTGVIYPVGDLGNVVFPVPARNIPRFGFFQIKHIISLLQFTLHI